MHIGTIMMCLLLIIQSAMPQMGCAETYNLLGTFLIWNIIMELYHETYMPSNTLFCFLCYFYRELFSAELLLFYLVFISSYFLELTLNIIGDSILQTI